MSETNIEQYLKSLKANQQLALDASAKTINSTLLEMYKKVVDRTPVGNPSLWNWPVHKDYQSGTLRESWTISFNGVQRNVTGQFASTAQVLGNNGLSFKVSSNNAQVAVISNPIPYAQRVETGWSTQAPQGMMRITAAEYASMLNENAAKYRTK